MEMGKQMFGKQMFAGPFLIMGHREDFDHKQVLLDSYQSIILSSY